MSVTQIARPSHNQPCLRCYLKTKMLSQKYCAEPDFRSCEASVNQLAMVGDSFFFIQPPRKSSSAIGGPCHMLKWAIPVAVFEALLAPNGIRTQNVFCYSSVQIQLKSRTTFYMSSWSIGRRLTSQSHNDALLNWCPFKDAPRGAYQQWQRDAIGTIHVL